MNGALPSSSRDVRVAVGSLCAPRAGVCSQGRLDVYSHTFLCLLDQTLQGAGGSICFACCCTGTSHSTRYTACWINEQIQVQTRQSLQAVPGAILGVDAVLLCGCCHLGHCLGCKPTQTCSPNSVFCTSLFPPLTQQSLAQGSNLATTCFCKCVGMQPDASVHASHLGSLSTVNSRAELQ